MADRSHRIRIDGLIIQTQRLTLRPWQLGDVDEALTIFGTDDVTGWLVPSLDRVTDAPTMRDRLSRWMAPVEPPLGHWAVVDHDSDQVVGSGQIIPLPPENRDLVIGYGIAPKWWGHGFGTEAGHALAHYAFENGQDEIFAPRTDPKQTRRSDRPEDRHGVGRRDGEVFWPTTQRVPAATR